MAGLPTNSSKAKTKGCSPVSSNCVVWQGQSLPCIDLCHGDTVSDVVFKAATELCTLMTMFDVTNYDISCLNVAVLDRPVDMAGLIKILIARVCALEGVTPTGDTGTASDCPTGCIVDILPCLQYTDQTGTLITSTNLYEYILLIANKVCEHATTITTMQADIATLQGQMVTANTNVATMQTEKAATADLQFQVSSEIDPATPTLLVTDALRKIESSLVNTQGVAGTSADALKAINKEQGIANEDKLATVGTLGADVNWTTPSTKLSDTIGNLWVAVKDVRAALANIVQNAASESCESILLNYQTTYNQGTSDVTFFTSGSTGFNANWSNCKAGADVTISDAVGNTVSYTIDMIALIAIPTGQVENIAGLGLDLTTTITTSVKACFTNAVSNVTCNNVYTSSHIPVAPCPTVVAVGKTLEVTLSVAAPDVGYSYRIELFDEDGRLPIDDRTYSLPPVGFADTYTGLDAATTYDYEAVVINGAGVETRCPRGQVTTL